MTGPWSRRWPCCARKPAGNDGSSRRSCTFSPSCTRSGGSGGHVPGPRRRPAAACWCAARCWRRPAAWTASRAPGSTTSPWPGCSNAGPPGRAAGSASPPACTAVGPTPGWAGSGTWSPAAPTPNCATHLSCSPGPWPACAGSTSCPRWPPSAAWRRSRPALARRRGGACPPAWPAWALMTLTYGPVLAPVRALTVAAPCLPLIAVLYTAMTVDSGPPARGRPGRRVEGPCRRRHSASGLSRTLRRVLRPTFGRPAGAIGVSFSLSAMRFQRSVSRLLSL